MADMNYHLTTKHLQKFTDPDICHYEIISFVLLQATRPLSLISNEPVINKSAVSGSGLLPCA